MVEGRRKLGKRLKKRHKGRIEKMPGLQERQRLLEWRPR
jgi:hypothetical protein